VRLWLKKCRYRLALAALVLASVQTFDRAHAKPEWDQVANIKAAAQNIGDIQKRGGADAAYKFIAACYKTHGLASAYGKAFEGCIAQDFIQSRALALVYQRVPADHLKSIGAPSVEALIASLQRRLGAAFAQYKIAPADGQAFLKIVEAQGLPVFMKSVFPEQAR